MPRQNQEFDTMTEEDYRVAPEQQPDLTPERQDDDTPERQDDDTPERQDDDTRPEDTEASAALEEMTARANGLQEEVDKLKRELFTALVAADGRLIDPSDLAYSPELVHDKGARDEAISTLIRQKPGLARVQYSGDIGAGRGQTANRHPVDLIGLLAAAL